jgi:hypothetical protein
MTLNVARHLTNINKQITLDYIFIRLLEYMFIFEKNEYNHIRFLYLKVCLFKHISKNIE